MRSMKSKLMFLAMTCFLAFLSSFGYVKELDFHDWHEEADSLPGGWTHYKLKKGVETGVWKGGGYFESKDGWLLSPVFDADIRSVSLLVATSSPDPTRFMHLHPISNGVTNMDVFAVAVTTSKYEEQVFQLEGYAARQIVFQFTGRGNTGNWGMIRIVVRYGDESTDEEEAVPLQSWSMAEIARKPGYRDADFGNLRYVYPEKTNPWKNGETVNGFYAFSKDGPCTNIRVGNPRSDDYGLYVIATNDVRGALRALSLLGTSGSAMELMLPIALDTASPVERLSVDYRIWELANGKSSELSFSYRTLDDLETMNEKDAVWTSVSNAVWETGDEDAVRTIDLPKEDVRGAEFLCLRWSVPKKESSSIVGLSDVRVSAEIEPSGFVLIVK